MVARLKASRRAALYSKRCRTIGMDDKTVLFEAYVGSGYTCSPKALYESMLEDPRFADFRFVWAFKDPEAYADVPALERATRVLWGSRAHDDAYARSRYWITNCAVPAHVAPRTGQIYLQTWHGSPLKRFGCDSTPVSTTGKAVTRRALDERAARWRLSGSRFTHFLSQSPFASEKLASAFGMDTATAQRVMIEEGYPRNDFLRSFTPSDLESIRTRLGLPTDKKLVLYAPTWRDDQRTPGLGYTLELGVDFEELRRELGEEYVILFRAHFMIADSFDFDRYGGFVRDVSRVDDVNELYVVSDMLVTDYSSVFFDYSNLERPVVFFMYDLEHYAEVLRGFYLDLDELPGPIVRSGGELVSAIRAAEATGPDARRLSRFHEKYAPWDDGGASRRVIDRVFGVEEDDWRSE